MEVPRREADCREAAVGAERVHDFPNVRCNGGRADRGVAIRPGKWGRLPLKQPPRRQEEAVPVHNDGLDNANSDLILYVVQEMLGQGTFGQVVKCWDTETNNFVAVKVIKNQPAFYQQAIMEVSLLSLLNVKFDPDDQHHIVRMLDFFLCQNHLCITFEMLGNNLYELLKRNSLRGLKMKFVRSFSRQILDTLIILKEAGIIHCDLKPENILITPTHNSATTDVETGPKLLKHRGWETLREHVGELRCRRDMEDTDLTDDDLFSDEMKINLHMLRLSPGGPGPMSLGASPSQFIPPNSQMQIPTGAAGKYGTSPARGGHGSSLGKAAAVGQYNRRRNLGYPPMPVPPHEHEHASQLIQGHQADVMNAARFDAYSRGNSGYSALPNSGHFSWRPQRGISSVLPSEPSTSSHGSFPPTHHNGFPPLHPSNMSADTLPSTSSMPDPTDWDPSHSDELLLQEDHSLSAEVTNLQLRDANRQTNRSSRLAPIQSHDMASSDPSSMNQRSEHRFHASSVGENVHFTGLIAFDGYNHGNYSQQSFPIRHGQPFQQYNSITSSSIRPMRTQHNGPLAWNNYSLVEPLSTNAGDRMPWGGRAGHSFASSGLTPSMARKDIGRIF